MKKFLKKIFPYDFFCLFYFFLALCSAVAEQDRAFYLCVLGCFLFQYAGLRETLSSKEGN